MSRFGLSSLLPILEFEGEGRHLPQPLKLFPGLRLRRLLGADRFQQALPLVYFVEVDRLLVDRALVQVDSHVVVVRRTVIHEGVAPLRFGRGQGLEGGQFVFANGGEVLVVERAWPSGLGGESPLQLLGNVSS